MYYCAFHIFSTNFKGPVWISEMKVCQPHPLPPLWRTCVDSTARSQAIDMLQGKCHQTSWLSLTREGNMPDVF